VLPLSRGRRPGCCCLDEIRSGSGWFETCIHVGSSILCSSPAGAFVARGWLRRSSSTLEIDHGHMCDQHHNARSKLSRRDRISTARPSPAQSFRPVLRQRGRHARGGGAAEGVALERQDGHSDAVRADAAEPINGR
jgi:hypothetical protein